MTKSVEKILFRLLFRVNLMKTAYIIIEVKDRVTKLNVVKVYMKVRILEKFQSDKKFLLVNS